MRQQTLTKSETQVMNILWDTGRGATVAEVLEAYDEPRPAYTTVATFLKILEQKGFVEHRKGTGKTLVYSTLLTRERYQRHVMDEVRDTLFGGSGVKLVSFFTQQESLSEEELEEIRIVINNLER